MVTLSSPAARMHVRPETPSDAAVIARIVEAAFANHPRSLGTEAAIVRDLRAAGALSVSLVAQVDGQTRGYVAASPVQIDNAAANWHGLGPVAVEPGVQRIGVGSLLINACLARLRALGAAGCVVLGEPAYYRRFGFKPYAELRYPGPAPEHFMALAFGARMARGVVSYHAAFASQP